MNLISRIFWNPAESRLRLLWRLAGQSLLAGIFLVFGLLILFFITGLFPDLSQSAFSLADLTDPSTPAAQMLLVISGLAVASSVWIAGRFLDRRPFQDFGFSISGSWWLDFLFGVGLGTGLMSGIFLLELLLGWVQIEAQLSIPAGRGAVIPGLMRSLMLYILIGFYEELSNRGYLIKNLSEGLASTRLNSNQAIAIAAGLSSLFFGILHSANPNSSIASTLNISLAGLFLAAGFLITGQLALPIGLHISWNFVQGSVYGFPVSGTSFGLGSLIQIQQSGPDLWTGGPFGPEAGLLGTAAMLIGTGLILAWMKFRTGQLGLLKSISSYPAPQENQLGSNPPLKMVPNQLRSDPSSKPQQHLIWDWNGTLLDDLELCLSIINQMLSERSLSPVSKKHYLEIFDFPVREYYQRLGFDFEKEPFESISTEFIQAYERGRPECQLMIGARAALSAASALGFTQSILSASKREYLLQAVNDYGIGICFTSIQGLDNHHAAGKADLAREFLMNSGLEPQRTTIIGDTVHDAAIAAALGTHCVLIPKGHHSRGRLSETRALIVDSLLDIPELLEEMKADG